MEGGVKKGLCTLNRGCQPVFSKVALILQTWHANYKIIAIHYHLALQIRKTEAALEYTIVELTLINLETPLEWSLFLYAICVSRLSGKTALTVWFVRVMRQERNASKNEVEVISQKSQGHLNGY